MSFLQNKKYNFSVKIMQQYDIFSVCGAANEAKSRLKKPFFLYCIKDFSVIAKKSSAHSSDSLDLKALL